MALDLQYDLVNYTPADASPVEANFNRAQQYINTELINRTGNVAMTAQLQLVGDPVADLDAVPKQYVDSFVPVASILMYGGATAPPGGKWALCNGAELEQAVYPVLFGRIGQTYGGTSGHFNLPNLAGKFPLGAGTDAIASTGGARDAIVPAHVHPVDHTHAAGTTSNELQAHTHNVSISSSTESVSHYHQLNWGNLFQQSSDPANNVDVFAVRIGDGITINMRMFASSSFPSGTESALHGHGVNGTSGGENVAHTHTVNVATFSGNSGAASGAAATTTNANLPPYLTINYIIRIS